MKKTLFLLALVVLASTVVGQWPPPTGLTAYSGLTDRVDLEWTAPPPIYTADTLAYDAGSGAGGGDLDSGYYSVRFTLAGRCSLIAVQASFYTLLGLRPVKFYFWGVDGWGYPNIHNHLATPVEAYANVGWNDIDISSAGIVLNTPSFFLGVGKHPLDTLPEFLIYYDNAPSDPVRSYRTWGGIYHFATPGDLLLRLVVMYLDTREICEISSFARPMPSEIPFGQKTVTPIAPFPDNDDVEFLPFNPLPPMGRARPSAPMTVTQADSIIIFRASTWGSSLSRIAAVAGSVTTYSDYSVTSGHTYYYTIRADFPGGESPMPDTVYGTPYSGDATTIYDTLRHDDGFSDAGVQYPGAVLADQFYAGTPCKLIRLDYHINTVGSGIPRIYLKSDGKPGTEILDYPSNVSFSGIGWRSVNVSGFGIFLDDTFYAGLEMTSGVGISLDAGFPGYAWDLPPSGTWQEISDTTYYIRALVEYCDGKTYYHLYPGWNAVSLPIIPSVGLDASTLFPFALGPIWGWNSDIKSWQSTTTLETGKGYFVLSDRDTNISLSGVPIHDYTIPWAGPWFEFIGGLSNYEGLDASEVSTTPSGIWDPPELFYWDAAARRWTRKMAISPSKAYFIILNDEGLFEAHE